MWNAIKQMKKNLLNRKIGGKKEFTEKKRSGSIVNKFQALN